MLARQVPSKTVAGCQKQRASVSRTRVAVLAQWSTRADATQERAAPHVLQRVAAAAAAAVVSSSMLLAGPALARLDPVNRPDLLPQGQVTSVIDVAGFLTPSEEKRIAAEVASLEADTGYKLRVLAQNYPETPGLAVREYWGVDANTIVFVADPTFANILNFNVGQGLDLEVPQSFWSRLAGKYGNKFYWQEKGEAAAITNAVSGAAAEVSAIDACLREPSGRSKCSQVQAEFGEQPSSGKFGKLLGQ
ncbi:Thylakoid lumenal 15.0 kDa protein 2, chloroplastic Flags: Precursor [Monoraphidium neglectum]|uniref:TPM domain-containing protein n=1 Tax=Monoraphidium neglectum TaxID=145388 RepID=A0A0D2MUJ2_9CHLO|nr:Thylakoid lumenal 15.0 kDa protein 2, chloroplastic Flags: Precursor [Monoraphidium neglectum]KIZ06205.1 Thylakoid lumenal 15.0 kDa protein 2, chloroplastic Flags: Precursor [Monoraphidium neglectum]|eukprot:XP_013905224.1 Thylakoid lumenal 15.0 kDa protein 2, chloroplastic Flags: Precursor [Monoraphidium neglectum]